MFHEKLIHYTMPERLQEICIGDDLRTQIASRINNINYDHIIFIVDKNVYDIHFAYIQHLSRALGVAALIKLKPTAHSKSYGSCDKIIRTLTRVKASRQSCLVAIGGGYISDMTGFVASIYMRGIDFIQLATTTMGMVDPVLGKVAVNYGGIKNLLGSFSVPRFTFCDYTFIKTMNESEKVYGLVEVWKHALLKKESSMIRNIESYLVQPNDEAFRLFVPFSIKTKMHFVQRDFCDRKGVHKALSLGHTLANYFEQQSSTRHGVAVFYGLIFEAILSYQLGYLQEKSFRSILETAAYFESHFGLFDVFKKKTEIRRVMAAFSRDKINRANEYNFVLPTDRGYVIMKGITDKQVIHALQKFRSPDFVLRSMGHEIEYSCM